MSKKPPNLKTKYETDDPDYKPGQSSSSKTTQSSENVEEKQDASYFENFSRLLNPFRKSDSEDSKIIEIVSSTESSPNKSETQHDEHLSNDNEETYHDEDFFDDKTETHHDEHLSTHSQETHPENDDLFNNFPSISHPQFSNKKEGVMPTDKLLIAEIVAAVLEATEERRAPQEMRPFIELEKLTKKNYAEWATKMLCALKLTGYYVDPTLKLDELEGENVEKNKKAAFFMTCYLDHQHSLLIKRNNPNCFITAWNDIEKFHRPRTTTLLTDFVVQMQRLTHQAGHSIEDHLTKLEEQFARVQNTEHKYTEAQQVAFILASLKNSPEFANVFHSALWENESKTLTVERVKSVLITTQLHIDEKSERAMHVNARSQQSSSKSQPNQQGRRSKNHNRQPDDPKRGWKCIVCEMDNHTTNNCRRNRSKTDLRNRFNGASFRPGSTRNANHAEDDGHIEEITHESHDFLKHSHNTNQFQAISPNAKHSALATKFNAMSSSTIEPHKPSQGMKYFNLLGLNQNFRMSSFIKQKNFNRLICNNTHEVNKTEIKSKLESDWIIDSGATSHMCKSANVLSNFVPHSGHKVIISDGSEIPIHGYGTLTIHIKDFQNHCTHKITLHKVAFVPKLSVNLISVKALASLGVSVKFTEKFCFIKNSRFDILLGKIANGSYILKTRKKNTLHDVKIDMAMSSCVHEWHLKMGHRNIAHIQRIKETLNLNVQKCKCSFECVGCLKGKLHSLPFPQESEKPPEPRDVITSDVCGPFRTPSLGGAKYFVTFTCAKTDYTEVAAIKHKSDCKMELINYVKRCMTQFGRFPKVIRSDRGGEYTDEDVQSYLRSNGIVSQLTVARCPQQNGISERKNRTLLEAIRTMLFTRNLPKHLWGEALHHANNTFNNIPRESNSKSPKEIFFNDSFDYPFIEFGAPVYYTTNSHDRSKLAERGAPGIYLGVDQSSKGFRIFTNGKIRVERHVKFLKEQSVDERIKLNESLHIDCTNEIPLAQDQNKIDSPIEIRRSERIRLQNANAVSYPQFYEPNTYKQAISCPDKNKWIEAMKSELESIEENQTWTPVELPRGKNAVGCRWVFKIKKGETEDLTRYKARLVAQGFTQKYGVDYDEVFAPVTRSSTFRTLLTVASARNLVVRQYDVKTAFLNGSLDEEIYMKPPPGFVDNNNVLKLHKSLYGLKQAARVWNQTLHKAMFNAGFRQSKFDECLYIYKDDSNVCYAIVHVDDMIFASNSGTLINAKIIELNKSFELKCLGDLKNYLGIEITRDDKGKFSINQMRYIEKVAKEFQLQDSKGSKFPLDPGYHKLEDENLLESNNDYRKIIGMLLYISTNTRPDISASVGILAQRVSKPRKLDFTEALRVVKYLHATKELKLVMFDENDPTPLTAFSDSDWAEDRSTRKSISGVLVKILGGTVSWSSRKQNIVSTSTTEAEFYALSEAVKEVQYLKNVLNDFDIATEETITIHSDNQSTIKMIKNPRSSSRTKHIDVRLHFVRDSVGQGSIGLKYCSSEHNVADLLTKPLAGVKIKYLRELAALIE